MKVIQIHLIHRSANNPLKKSSVSKLPIISLRFCSNILISFICDVSRITQRFVTPQISHIRIQCLRQTKKILSFNMFFCFFFRFLYQNRLELKNIFRDVCLEMYNGTLSIFRHMRMFTFGPQWNLIETNLVTTNKFF